MLKESGKTSKVIVCRIVDNQNGIALILAMIMLFLLSLLGAFALSTSTTEISISGNQKRVQEAFYAADAALERAQTDGSIYSSIGTGSYAATWTIADGNPDTPDNRATVAVNYVTGGNLPLNAPGTDAELFRADYFIVSVTGTGPSGSNTEVGIESQIARVVPR